MRRYATSKFRVVLLLLALGAAVWGTGTSYGQDSSGPTSQPSGSTRGVTSLIMENRDFVFFTILGCSVVAVTLIVQGFLKVRRAVLIPPATTARMREMILNRQFKELMDFADADPSFVSKAMGPALKRAPSFAAMKEAMETAIGEQTAEQFRRIEYLNIIGNLGPLLGLLGTVLGMIESFNQLYESGGNANPALLGLGISKALTHTMLGLMLAIPCLACFGILRTMVDRLTVQGALTAEELLMMIKPPEARPVAAAAAAPPRPAVAAAARPAAAAGSLSSLGAEG